MLFVLLGKIKTGTMQERIKLFANTIVDKLKQNENKQDYELVLVAHSVGTIVCIEVLECILRQNLDLSLLHKLKFYSRRMHSFSELSKKRMN